MEKLEIQQDPPSFKKLIPIKLHFLLSLGGAAAVAPYIYIFAKQLGLTADVVGYITSVLWCVTVLSRIVLGGLADHFQKFKLMVLINLLFGIVSNIALNFIPVPIENVPTNTSIICDQNNSYLIKFNVDACSSSDLSNCRDNCIVSCSLCERNSTSCIQENAFYSQYVYTDIIPLDCFGKLVSQCGNQDLKEKCVVGNSSDSVQTIRKNAPLQVGLFSIFTSVFFVASTTVAALSDAACFNILGEKTGWYGRQRAWGTIGFGAFSFLAGYLNDVFTGSSSITNYSACFFTSMFLFIFDFALVWKMDLKNVKPEKNIFKDVGSLLLKPRIFLFLLQVIGAGMMRGVYMAYLFWYLETLNASQLLMGLITFIQCFVGEVPFLFIAGWIIKKIGHLNVFTISFVAHGMRFLAYAFLVNPWWGLLVEVLQGPSFGSFYAAATSYAKIVSPPGAEATMQGITHSGIEGLGAALGSVVGGYAVHTYGGQTAFFWVGILSIIFGMCSCIINGVLACNLIP